MVNQDDSNVPQHVTLLVKHIPSATDGLTSVRPDQTLAEAQTLMIAHEYSQVAVLTDGGRIEGAVSWRSIGRTRLTKREITLHDATARCKRVNVHDRLLDLMDVIYHDDFVLVQDDTETLCGIITTADLAMQFRDLTKQFFHIGDIEGRLRRSIDRFFGVQDLRLATGQSSLRSAKDMTFGQYVRMFRAVEIWQRLPWNVDQAMFVSNLDRVRIARNKVMHSSGELNDDDNRELDSFFNLMQALDPDA